MMNENLNVQMRLVSVREMSFSMSLCRDEVAPDDVNIGFSSQLLPDMKNGLVSLLFGIRYEISGEPILEAAYQFVFDVKEFKRYVVSADNQDVVDHLMPHFLNVAVGTVRGILVVRTAGTNLSKYPLPIVDINKLAEELSSTMR